jgi:hypothetical protein
MSVWLHIFSLLLLFRVAGSKRVGSNFSTQFGNMTISIHLLLLHNSGHWWNTNLHSIYLFVGTIDFRSTAVLESTQQLYLSTISYSNHLQFGGVIYPHLCHLWSLQWAVSKSWQLEDRSGLKGSKCHVISTNNTRALLSQAICSLQHLISKWYVPEQCIEIDILGSPPIIERCFSLHSQDVFVQFFQFSHIDRIDPNILPFPLIIQISLRF